MITTPHTAPVKTMGMINLRVAFFLALSLLVSVCFAVKPHYANSSKQEIKANHISYSGELVKALKFENDGKTYWVVFSKSLEQEKVSLFAAAYQIKADKVLHKEWTFKKVINCPELDFEADFLTQYIDVLDLDKDLTPEVVFAYKTFCGGGVEPKDVGVEIRSETLQHKASGTTLIKIPQEPAIGGTMWFGKSLQEPKNLVFKTYMKRALTQIINEQ